MNEFPLGARVRVVLAGSRVGDREGVIVPMMTTRLGKYNDFLAVRLDLYNYMRPTDHHTFRPSRVVRLSALMPVQDWTGYRELL